MAEEATQEETPQGEAPQDEEASFSEAFGPGEEAPKGEEEERTEATPDEPEGETEAGSEEPDDVTSETDEVRKEDRRRSLLGRIQASRKGLPQMEEAYRAEFGRLPWERTPEEEEAAQRRAEAAERVRAEAPEIGDAIEHALERALAENETKAETAQREEALRLHIDRCVEAHEDYVQYTIPGTTEAALLDEWVRAHPYEEGRELDRVRQEGTAAEVIQLLDAFKSDLQQLLENQPPDVEGPVVTAKSQVDAEVVPAGAEARVLSDPHVDPNDFAGAFAAATAEAAKPRG